MVGELMSIIHVYLKQHVYVTSLSALSTSTYIITTMLRNP